MSTKTEMMGLRAGVLSYVFEGLGERVSKRLDALRERREQRRVADELSMLSDRELADIGVTRGDLHCGSAFGGYEAVALLARRP